MMKGMVCAKLLKDKFGHFVTFLLEGRLMANNKTVYLIETNLTGLWKPLGLILGSPRVISNKIERFVKKSNIKMENIRYKRLSGKKQLDEAFDKGLKFFVVG